jgi:NAD(P)-dependent dehydrogenase (short-subunit alcohol dehydrogenase family)
MLHGKTAIVTGSSTGIGRAIAEELARQGARVVINARGSRAAGVAEIDSVVQDIRNAGGEAIGVAGAVDDPAFASTLVNACMDSFGRLDILINNAGIYSDQAIGPVDQCSIDEWRRIMSVNLDAVFQLSREALPIMKRQRWGRILNAASFAGTGKMGGSAYSASKAALFGLGRAMAGDYGPWGITVNTYCPEATTDMGNSVDPAALQAMVDYWADRGFRSQSEIDYIMGLKGPEGIAPFITYLCLPEADAINGHVFSVEGRRIALLAAPDEERILFRDDYDSRGPWRVTELQAVAPMAFPLTNTWPARSEEQLSRWEQEQVA